MGWGRNMGPGSVVVLTLLFPIFAGWHILRDAVRRLRGVR